MILMPTQSDAGEWQAFRSEEHWIISYKLSCFCYLAVSFICVLFYFVHIGQVCGDHDDTGQDLLSAHHLWPVHTGRSHIFHHGPAYQAYQRRRKCVWVWSVWWCVPSDDHLCRPSLKLMIDRLICFWGTLDFKYFTYLVGVSVLLLCVSILCFTGIWQHGEWGRGFSLLLPHT